MFGSNNGDTMAQRLLVFQSLWAMERRHTDGYERTLEEIGKMYNVTRERIRQIEAKALRKLRHPTRVRHLQGFLDTPEPEMVATA